MSCCIHFLISITEEHFGGTKLNIRTDIFKSNVYLVYNNRRIYDNLLTIDAYSTLIMYIN